MSMSSALNAHARNAQKMAESGVLAPDTSQQELALKQQALGLQQQQLNDNRDQFEINRKDNLAQQKIDNTNKSRTIDLYGKQVETGYNAGVANSMAGTGSGTSSGTSSGTTLSTPSTPVGGGSAATSILPNPLEDVIPSRATGGRVPGPDLPSNHPDNVLIKARSGEYVIPKELKKKLDKLFRKDGGLDGMVYKTTGQWPEHGGSGKDGVPSFQGYGNVPGRTFLNAEENPELFNPPPYTPLANEPQPQRVVPASTPVSTPVDGGARAPYAGEAAATMTASSFSNPEDRVASQAQAPAPSPAAQATPSAPGFFGGLRQGLEARREQVKRNVEASGPKSFSGALEFYGLLPKDRPSYIAEDPSTLRPVPATDLAARMGSSSQPSAPGRGLNALADHNAATSASSFAARHGIAPPAPLVSHATEAQQRVAEMQTNTPAAGNAPAPGTQTPSFEGQLDPTLRYDNLVEQEGYGRGAVRVPWETTSAPVQQPQPTNQYDGRYGDNVVYRGVQPNGVTEFNDQARPGYTSIGADPNAPQQRGTRDYYRAQAAKAASAGHIDRAIVLNAIAQNTKSDSERLHNEHIRELELKLAKTQAGRYDDAATAERRTVVTNDTVNRLKTLGFTDEQALAGATAASMDPNASILTPAENQARAVAAIIQKDIFKPVVSGDTRGGVTDWNNMRVLDKSKVDLWDQFKSWILGDAEGDTVYIGDGSDRLYELPVQAGYDRNAINNAIQLLRQQQAAGYQP